MVSAMVELLVAPMNCRNYDAAATDDDGMCEYAEEYYDCDGNINDADGDGVCDGGRLQVAPTLMRRTTTKTPRMTMAAATTVILNSSLMQRMNRRRCERFDQYDSHLVPSV